MSRRKGGSAHADAATPATTELTRAGIPFVVRQYEHDAAAIASGVGYGEEAAAALGVDPATVYKTLVVDVGGRLGVVVIPVLDRVDLKAAAAALGGKRAALADPQITQRTTGYVVGGISPLGQRKRLPTVVDSSALAHPRILVSGGRRGFDIDLAPVDLIAVTGAVTATVTSRR